MKARKGARGGPRSRPPQWLSTFTLADWYDADEPVPLADQVDLGEMPWRCLQAHERWRRAGLDWLGEAGYGDSPAGWRRVVDASDWGTDPHRLARQVHRAA